MPWRDSVSLAYIKKAEFGSNASYRWYINLYVGAVERYTLGVRASDNKLIYRHTDASGSTTNVREI